LGLKWKRVYGIYGENAYTYIPDVHSMAKRRGIDLDPNLVPPLMSQKGIFEQFGSVVNSYLRLKTEATLNGFMVREDGRNGRPVARTYNGFVQFSQNSSRPELEGLAGRKAKKIKDLLGRLVADPVSQDRFTLITNDEV